ncbi:helix-turn-helix domain-containing protein [Comamonas sp. Y33R10-2]|uniref:helix-turn-helix domain-containing protein n=1 Tax=Comamonas sp. Y33R10-2 TaxID=2853257 RepID=UPI001C5C9C86|nr:helix-turn-helix transcriptional regulator [Comamonas sp. Y33R10-2]QXZ10257.1 helix-turn-helix domain-containing protein [Comamonas sp. Y33R10-2]
MGEFFERLREERKRLGLSQTELGELGGVSKNAQSNYETGSRLPDVGYLVALKSGGVDIAYLLSGDRSFDPNRTNHAQSVGTVAGRLLQERKRLGLTIGQLAEKAGVERLALMKWEEGEYRPDSAALQQLHAAGVDVAYVLLSLVGGSQGDVASAADEQELLKLYRAAPNEQAKSTARMVLSAAVDSFLPTSHSKNLLRD